jgi:hypothetical protein
MGVRRPGNGNVSIIYGVDKFLILDLDYGGFNLLLKFWFSFPFKELVLGVEIILQNRFTSKLIHLNSRISCSQSDACEDYCLSDLTSYSPV